MSSLIGKRITALLSALALSGCMFFLGSCEKQEPSSEYFEECLTGNWCVREFYTSDGITILHNQEDCVEYQKIITSKIYEVDNPIFCRLEMIENIQMWQIQPQDGDLELEASDLCGQTNIYSICYSELEYFESRNGSVEGISATVSFLGMQKSICWSTFYLYPDSGELWVTCTTEEGVNHKMLVCKL